MRRGVVGLGLAVALVLGGLGLAGPGASARLALGVGLSGVATSLAPEGPWRAVALYRSAEHDAAAHAFGRAPEHAFNRGNALARAGRYAAALVAYEEALHYDPRDGSARHNHALVAALYASLELDVVPLNMQLKDRDGPTIAAQTGKGTGRAQGSGDEADALATSFDTPTLAESGLRRTARFFDSKHIAATDRWLTNLPDSPGEYLRARLAAERKRRRERAREEARQ